MSIETLKLFEALLNLPHEAVLRNLVLRNLEDRAYFTEPSVTNGEVTKNEACGAANSEGNFRDDKESGKDENEGVNMKSKSSTYFDKQKIEKIVNG